MKTSGTKRQELRAAERRPDFSNPSPHVQRFKRRASRALPRAIVLGIVLVLLALLWETQQQCIAANGAQSRACVD